MNELMNNEVRITSVELVKLINEFRLLEDNKAELLHKDFMKKIRKELETLKALGLGGEGNISPSSYINSQNKEQPCYSLNRDGMLQMLNSESTLVRFKTIEYINALENKLKEQDEKKNLLLAIYEGGQNAISASKRLTELEVKEATKPLLDKIEKDEPLVTFAEQVLKDGDNILVRELAKLTSDHLNIKIGEKNLYKKLREWKYICINSTEPTQMGMNLEYFIVETRIINTPYGSKQTHIIDVLKKYIPNIK